MRNHCPIAARPFLRFLAACGLTIPLAAQCGANLSSGPANGPAAAVTTATLWDPDGPGPAPVQIAMVAGSNRVVAYQPTTGVWASVGPQFGNTIACLAAMPNGDLLAGGRFTQVGGTVVNKVAKWDGAQWQPIGAGFSGDVTALVVMPDGAPIAGGYLAAYATMARWNGTSWVTIGTSLQPQLYPPRELQVMANGDLVAGGWFSEVSGVPARGVARWDGAQWFAMDAGLSCLANNGRVDLLTLGHNQELLAVCTYQPSLGYPTSCLSRWTGSQWTPVGNGWIGVGGLWNLISAVVALPNGDLVAAGNFTIGGVERFVAHWNGSNWDTMAGGTDSGVLSLLTLPAGDVFVSGNFTTAGYLAAHGVASWDGTAWHQVGGAINGVVHDVAELPSGGLVVVGAFSAVGDLPAKRVALWQGGSWSVLGGGLGGSPFAFEWAHRVVVMPNGDVVIGGYFPQADGVTANSIARWDGVAWHALGNGVTGSYGATWIEDMVVMPNGDLIVGGSFATPYPYLARWNGSAWSSLAAPTQMVSALAVDPNGDLFVAYNELGGARVLRWDGVGWSQLGQAPSTAWRVTALDVGADGRLVAGGVAPSVATWNGAQWQAVGGPFPSYVEAVCALPGGGIVAGGPFDQPGRRLARWDGASWQGVGTGLDGTVFATRRLASGAVALAGDFVTANDALSPHVAMLTSTCPANAVSYGVACQGALSTATMQATQWPMLGGFLRSRTTGLAANSLAVAVFGFSQIQVPLSTGHPLGWPGCDVLVADEILIQFLVGNGQVDASIAIPNIGALVGTSFYHQVVPVELDSSGAILAITSSNALALTIGAL